MDQRYDESEFWSADERPTVSLPAIRRSSREGRARLLTDPTPRTQYRVSTPRPSAEQFRRRRLVAIAGVVAVALVGVVSLSGGDGNNGGAINPLSPPAPAVVSSTTSTTVAPEETVVPDETVDTADPAAQEADVAAQVVAPRAAKQTPARKTVTSPRIVTAEKSSTKSPAAKKATTTTTTVAARKRSTTTTDAPSTKKTTTTSQTTRKPAARSTLARRPTCRNAKYRVRAGDSWIAITRKAKTNLNALLRANGATARTRLFAGMTVCLPARAKGGTTSTTLPGRTTTTTIKSKPKPTTTTSPGKTTTSTVKPKPTTTTTEPKSTTSTTKPKPTTTTTAVPRKNTYTQEEIKQIIRQVWPDDQEDKAIAISWRESNWNPTVRNFCCFGLFQIYWNVHKGWLSSMGITSSDMLFDPRINATAALALYQRAGGWAPWSL